MKDLIPSSLVIELNIPWVGPLWLEQGLWVMKNPHTFEEFALGIAVKHDEAEKTLCVCATTDGQPCVSQLYELAVSTESVWHELGELPQSEEATGYLIVTFTGASKLTEWFTQLAANNAEMAISHQTWALHLKPSPIASAIDLVTLQTLVNDFIRFNPTTWMLAYIQKAVITQRISSEPIQPFNTAFAVACCQYSSGIFDKPLAEAGYNKLAQQNDIEALLLIGDQIYADATSGVLDPVRAEDKYDRRYIDWLRIPAVRSLMKRIPFYTVLDDHEIDNNWRPSRRPTAEQTVTLATALAAFWRYQRYQNTLPAVPDIWMKPSIGGHSVFMLDTRSEREVRTWSGTAGSKIAGEPQIDALKAWLQMRKLEDQAGLVVPKMITSPVWLLPRLAGKSSNGQVAAEHFSRCDAWSGYPDSLRDVLKFIGDEEISGVVFLTGDAHLGGYTSCKITKTGANGGIGGKLCSEIEIHFFHVPALYAPLPFVNARPCQFLVKDEIELGTPTQPMVAEIDAHLDVSLSGHLHVKLEKTSSWSVTVSALDTRSQQPVVIKTIQF